MTSNNTLQLQHATVLVVGLGKSGLSAVRTLHELGAQVRITDSRMQPPGLDELQRDFPQLPCYLGGFSAAAFAGIDCLVVSPGVSVQTPLIYAAAQRGIPVWGDIELFAQLVRVPVAVITGSNGKSTVTALLGAMALQAGIKAGVGGNLGQPALELLRQEQNSLYILELSSFQLETTVSLQPVVAALLNISPDHMDRYACLQDYINAKQRIFQNAGCCVYNADDALTIPGSRRDASRRLVSFTCQVAGEDEYGLYQDYTGETWLCYGHERFLPASELKISGTHNLCNALAALAIATELGFPDSAMLSGLRNFTGLPHRSELVAECAGVRWFNDSKGTNVGATVAAVNGLAGQVVLIAGGEGKDQDFTPLRAALKSKVRDLIIIGRDGPLIANVVEDLLPVHRAASLQQAVQLAAELAVPGENVLLSPACASFDMFSSYEERGAVFTAAARDVVQQVC